MKTKAIIALALALSALPARADSKVSALPTLTSGTLDPAADLIYIIDTSAGTSGSKAIVPNELFTGWGITSAGSTIVKAGSVGAQRTALGLDIGTNVQAWDADLDGWAAKAVPSGTLVDDSSVQTLTNKTLSNLVISLGTNATGDLYYRSSTSGLLARLPIGSTGQVLTVASGLPSWATPSGGGGGLVNLTETLNTASPNSTSWPTVGLTATGTASDMNVALVTKGTGSILADIPNGSSSGGNARGWRCVDLQIDRNTATKVASGDFSTISGGSDNAATGNTSTVGGGGGNTASGSYSTIGGGLSNAASGSYSTVGGGQSNTASGSYSMVGGGSSNTASGDYSAASGRYATSRGVYGMSAMASGRFSTLGDAQRGSYLLRRSTTDATQAEASADGGTPGSANRMILPDNHTFAFRGRVVARSSAGDVAVWTIEGAIKRGSGAGTVALVGTPTSTQAFADAGAASWTVTIDADTTNGTLRIQVTGAAATTIHWVADIETVEVS